MARKKSNVYWTTELDAIIDQYNKTDDKILRDKLFVKIYPALSRLVEAVLKFLLKGQTNIDEYRLQELQLDCISKVMSNFHHYKKENGSSFSYYQSIIKFHYIDVFRKDTLNKNLHIPITNEDNTDDDNDVVMVDSRMIHTPSVDENAIREDLIDYLYEKESLIKKSEKIKKEILLFIIEYLKSGGELMYETLKTRLFEHFTQKVNEHTLQLHLIKLGMKMYLKEADKDRRDSMIEITKPNFEWLDEAVEDNQVNKGYYLDKKQKQHLTDEEIQEILNRYKEGEVEERIKSNNDKEAAFED